MNRISAAVLAVFACLLLVAVAEPALADCLGGGGGRDRRGAPTRSSLSGLGVGLGAIGAAWAVTWIGIRLAGRVSRK